MSAPIPIARPLLGDEEAEAAARVVRSGWVMQGPEVAAFEREFAAAVGAPHACAVSSGTAALHLALLAVGVRAGDEVVTVSHSYIATANSIRHCGARPVFVDIEPGTFNVEARLVERAISSRTRALLCVHQMGMPCDMSTLIPLAQARGLRVVEDAACAIGSELERGGWHRIGKPDGDIATFSFHPRKVLTTGDGGMLTTADPELDAFARRLRQHGSLGEAFTSVGFNYRLTDVQAAIGRAQLRRLDGLVEERRALAHRYGELLSGHSVGLPLEPAWARSNWQSYCVRLPGLEAAEVIKRLAVEGISARAGIMNAHLTPAYADAGPFEPLPESERAQRECVCLPLFPGMTGDEQARVVGALLAAR